jgi:predicted Zn-dependent protease
VLTERDTVVLADFDNRTADPAFDYALKQALAIDLQQSPFLRILSDQQVADTLRLMLRSPEQRLRPDIARAVCQRTGSNAVLSGTITSLGSEYVIGLVALNCETGDVLTQEQVRANRKEEVLNGLDIAASRLRRKLGESLASVQRYVKPTHEALSTASLDAFEAYANGERMVQRQGNPAAIPFMRRAIELDPNFAYAYSALGLVYGTVGETKLATEYTSHAYAPREKVSEWEKFFISVQYYLRVTGEIEKALQLGQVWSQNYPRERTAHNRVADGYRQVGQNENALDEFQQARRLGGDNAIDVAALAGRYMALDRLPEAKGLLREAFTRNAEQLAIRQGMYLLSFLDGDMSHVQEQVDWAINKPGAEGLLGSHSNTEAYFGHFKKARELSRLAAASAQHNDFRERAAMLQCAEAVREAEFGNAQAARRQARDALAALPGPDVQVLAALAFARAGAASDARRQADRLNADFPLSTLMQNYWLPTIRAEIELDTGNPKRAIELLHTTGSYELADTLLPLIPVYVRGEAYFRAKQGNEAAAEFQKILQHRGIVANSPVGALAHLGLARAFALAGDTAKARAAYQDFFTLWKDADPDIPVLKQAKAEYARIL